MEDSARGASASGKDKRWQSAFHGLYVQVRMVFTILTRVTVAAEVTRGVIKVKFKFFTFDHARTPSVSDHHDEKTLDVMFRL